jgi:hypothetical protein
VFARPTFTFADLRFDYPDTQTTITLEFAFWMVRGVRALGASHPLATNSHVSWFTHDELAAVDYVPQGIDAPQSADPRSPPRSYWSEQNVLNFGEVAESELTPLAAKVYTASDALWLKRSGARFNDPAGAAGAGCRPDGAPLQ